MRHAHYRLFYFLRWKTLPPLPGGPPPRPPRPLAAATTEQFKILVTNNNYGATYKLILLLCQFQCQMVVHVDISVT